MANCRLKFNCFMRELCKMLDGYFYVAADLTIVTSSDTDLMMHTFIDFSLQCSLFVCIELLYLVVITIFLLIVVNKRK